MIKNFSDIEKKLNELNDENKKKFLLLVNDFFNEIDRDKSLLSLKSSFIKNDNNIPIPPPPPPPILPSASNIDNTGFNPLKTRTISSAPAVFNKPLTSTSFNSNKKKYLDILEGLAYISVIITDIGREALNPKLMIETDIYRFLKLILQEQISLKDIYIMEFSNKYKLGKYLEKIYLMSKEKYFICKKNKSLNENEEINLRIGDLSLELNYINKEQLELALKIQRGEESFPREEELKNNTNIGINLAQQVMQKINTNNNVQKPKLLLGNVLIELKYIDKEKLDYLLGLQRWLKYNFETLR